MQTEEQEVDSELRNHATEIFNFLVAMDLKDAECLAALGVVLTEVFKLNKKLGKMWVAQLSWAAGLEENDETLH